MYTEDNKLLTLQALINQMISSMDFLAKMKTEFGIGEAIPVMTTKMAMCVLVALPALIIFPFFQSYFQKGLTIGAVKE